MRISPKHVIGRRAKQILKSDLDNSLAEISDLPSSDSELDEFVHDIRKRLKKMRALLRLLRPRLGGQVYQRENRQLRDAARLLRDIRDTEALLGSLEKLNPSDSESDLQIPATELRCDLLDRKEMLSAQLRQSRLICDELTERLRAVKSRLKTWRLKRLQWSEVRNRLQHEWTRCVQTFQAAAAQPVSENVHEWRKQVKYLSNQLEVLKPIWREVEDSLGKDLDQLADLLGDAHDLAVLNQVVAGYITPHNIARSTLIAEAEISRPVNVETSNSSTEFEELSLSIEVARQDLQQSAFVLGHHIFSPSRRQLFRDMDRWWKGAS